MIPDRLLKILRSCETDDTSHFPPTEIYNEGWMLRLVLDAAQEIGLRNHPLEFLAGARWYSEALLNSAFLPRMRGDNLAEGFTRADAVIGQFYFAESTSAGIRIRPDASQFVVLEAKMFSNLSKGTTRAPLYDQAARNVACMAETVARSGLKLEQFEKIGFFVIAPAGAKRGRPDSNLEACVTGASIRTAIENRIAMYELAKRPEAETLRRWEETLVVPLIERMTAASQLAVASWERCIDAIGECDKGIGKQLRDFYAHCLAYAPRLEIASGAASTTPSP